MFILIETNGYYIEMQKFYSFDEAKSTMDAAYNASKPNESEWYEEFKDMSYLSDDEANLYTGEDVFLWNIFEI